jgi:hypothetical protein
MRASIFLLPKNKFPYHIAERPKYLIRLKVASAKSVVNFLFGEIQAPRGRFSTAPACGSQQYVGAVYRTGRQNAGGLFTRPFPPVAQKDQTSLPEAKNPQIWVKKSIFRLTSGLIVW